MKSDFPLQSHLQGDLSEFFCVICMRKLAHIIISHNLVKENMSSSLKHSPQYKPVLHVQCLMLAVLVQPYDHMMTMSV